MFKSAIKESNRKGLTFKAYTLCVILMVNMMCFGLCGCGSSSSDDTATTKATEDEYTLYYVSLDTTSLVKKNERFDKTETTDSQIEKMITKLTKDVTTVEYKSILPENVTYDGYTYGENKIVSVKFEGDFYSDTTSSKVLCEAAFTRSLCQIEGVEGVCFIVHSEPLTLNGKNVGVLTPESFVDTDTRNDINDVQYETIYFANVTGDKLEGMRVPVNVSGNKSAEEIIINKLIAGTTERGYYNTIPEGTTLLSVSTKDNTCYVDLSEEFMTLPEGILDQTVIYSIVDSLCGLSNVDKVSFTIEGEQVELYNGNVPFDQIFVNNSEIIDEE